MKIDNAYRFVKRQIIDGIWKPDTAINVNELAEKLNMSRTPVHKALNKLEQEGFLTIIPQVGVYVKRPDMQEVQERLLVCANLDALMTEYAAMKLNEEELKDLEVLLLKMDNLELSYEEYSELNVEFHSVIYKAAKLTFAFNLASQLWEYLYYVGNPEFIFSSERRKQSQTEHWMIYYSLLEKDSKLAKRLMEDHMRRVAKFVGERYHGIDEEERISD